MDLKELKMTDEELQEHVLKKEVTVNIKHLNWDQQYVYDKYTGEAIDIYEKPYNNKRGREKNPHGIMSQEFCSTWDDIDSFTERYKCSCGDLKGKALEGEVCEKCNTKVVYIDIDYRKTGWISLNGYKIIQPNYYNLLESLIGGPNLLEILNKHVEIDIDGNEKFTEINHVLKKTNKSNMRIRTEEYMVDKYNMEEGIVDKKEMEKLKEKELKKAMTKNPFVGKGILWLSENIKDVIYYFYKKNKNNSENKANTALFLLSNLDKIFASHIPVYSAALRPEKVDGETFSFYQPNSLYNLMVTSSWILYDNEMVDLNSESTVRYDIEKSLVQIQTSIMKLDEILSNTLNGKSGFLVSNILGGNYTYSSRCVIVPDASLKLEEVDLPYVCFGELFKFEIIGHMTKLYGISESEAYNMWNHGMCEYDEMMYQIMEYIIDTQQPSCIVGRNPKIMLGPYIVIYR